jgi:hypothetical protein
MEETAEEKQVRDEWYALDFEVKKSIRYHTRRRCFFERVGVLTNFLTVITGSGTGVSSFIGTRVFTAFLGFMTAGFSAIDLIVSYSTKARHYHDLAREFIALESEMNSVGRNPTEKDLIRAKNKRLEIESEEPPKLCILDISCHNQVAKSMGHNESIYSIPRLRGLLCHLHDWDQEDCKLVQNVTAKPQTPTSLPSAVS